MPAAENELIDSREIAEKAQTRHYHVIRDIENIIKRNPIYETNFIKSSYQSGTGRKYKMYFVNQEGASLLNTKYELGFCASRLQTKFEEMLRTMFPNEQIITECSVLNYRIDFFFPEIGICVEYDENHHVYQKTKDKAREQEIQSFLKEDYLKNVEDDPVIRRNLPEDSFPFLRVREGEEVAGLRKLLLLMEELTNSNVTQFIK